MKRYACILLALLFAGCAASRRSAVATAPTEKQYVVILSMDAFRWDLAGRSHTPTLDSLARAGPMPKFIRSTPPTPSEPLRHGHGPAPDHHGVVNNGFYDRKIGRRLSVFDSLDVRTAGILERRADLEYGGKTGLTANIFMWPGSEVPIDGHQATVWTPYSSKPTYYQRADWVIEAMTRPEAEIPELVMWYFEEPDATMHTYGPESPEAVGRAEHIDSVLRYFFREIRRSPVFERINFIVTADHGMAALSPERYINLLPLLDTAQVVRVVPGTPFGLEVKEEYADQAVRTLRRTGHMKAWRREQMPRRFHYGTHPTRLTNIIVIPETGWTLDYAAAARPVRKRGTHGFDNRDRDMHMVFYASGPAFRKGYRQGSFQNQNMYLILCRLLGIEPAPNDGEWRDIKRMFNEN